MRWTFLLLSVFLVPSALAQASPDATLTSPDVEFGMEFGRTVAIAGMTAAVGAPEAEEGDRDTGAVTLFDRQPDGTWVQGQRLVPSGLAGSRFNERERFGVALALDGDRLAVGAPGDDEGATRQVGAVYIFERQPDGTWTEVAVVREDAPLAFGGLGSAVALDGDRLIATAQRLSDPATGYEGGTVKVFDRQPDGSWTTSATLTRPEAEGRAFFGEAVALDGNRALIGATGSTSSTNRHGRAYIYELVTGTWSEVADLEAPDGQVFNTGNFGEAVALRGDQALIADPSRSILYPGEGTFASGAAYLFERSGAGTWTVAERFIPNDLDRAELSSSRQIDFGASAALANGRVVIGVPEDFVDGQFNAGSAYVFEESDGVWASAGKLRGGTDIAERFGTSVSESGGLVVAGAVLGEVSGTETGLAYVHELGTISLPTLSLFVQESVGVTDDPGLLAALQLLVQESIGVTDAPDLLTALLLLVREQISVADAPGLTREDGSASSGGAPVLIDTDLVRFLGPTGLAVQFDSVRVAGGVSVLFETLAPDDPAGIPDGATLAPYRWIVRASSELAFDSAAVVFDLSALPLVALDGGQDVVVYRRPTPGAGTFEALETEVEADTVRGAGLTAFSEFALAGRDVIVDDEEVASPSIFGLSNPAPNPARSVSRVTLSLPVASPVRVELLDIQGRRVSTLVDGDLPAGETALEIRANALAAGVYVVFVQAGDQMAATRLTVVR